MSAARTHLQAVSRQLVAIQEAERARIARDLHDEIGQMLTGLKLVLAIGTRSTPAMVLARLAEAQALINDLTTRVREISLDLRPAMLDDLGLLPTLLWHVKRYTEQTQIQVTIKHTGLDQRVIGCGDCCVSAGARRADECRTPRQRTRGSDLALVHSG